MGDATTYKRILYYGDYSNYVALGASIDPDLLYFCTDVGKLFKGTVDFSNSFKSGTASQTPVVADAIPGIIYYETDTKKFLTKIGNELVEIGNPIDAVGDSTTSTITASASDAHVPSSKNVWMYGQEILSQAIGGSAVVKNVTADQTTAAGIIVTMGDDSTNQVVVKGAVTGVTADANTAGQIDFAVSGGSTTNVVVPGVLTDVDAGTTAATLVLTLTDSTDAITVPGVVTGVAKDTTNDAQMIVTLSDNSTTAVGLKGVVHSPSWDETNLKLTLPVTDGTDIEVNIPKDIFLDDGYYDTTNKEIVLVLNDSSSHVVRFAVSDLIPIYEAKDTSTVDTSVTWNTTTGKYEISADVKISDVASNALTYDATGLVVDGSRYATTSDLATVEGSLNNLAAAALQWGSFNS